MTIDAESELRDNRGAIHRWLRRSLGHAILGFTLAFVVLQPLGYLLPKLALSEPSALVTSREWVAFLATVATLGALAGGVWHYSRNITARTWKRTWVDWSIVALTISIPGAAIHFSSSRWGLWVATIVISAPLTGGFFAILRRLVTNSEKLSRAA